MNPTGHAPTWNNQEVVKGRDREKSDALIHELKTMVSALR